MPLAGVRLVRQVFGDLLPPGWTVAQAQMDYEHGKDRDGYDVEWQVLTFHVIDPQGKPHKLKSDRVSARDDINELAIATAKKVAEGRFEDEPPHGIDPKDG